MQKESRANLIFFSILVILIAPGFVILMKKKLSGSSEPAHLPPLVPHEAAYIQPEPIPPRAPRIEPPEVRAWVTKLLHDRINPTLSLVRDPNTDSPIVGNRFTTQLVYVNQDKLAFLIWSTHVTSVNVSADGLNVLSTDPVAWIEVPTHIRHSLQKVGYINPPERIAWLEVKFSGALPGGTRVKIVYPPAEESITLPSRIK